MKKKVLNNNNTIFEVGKRKSSIARIKIIFDGVGKFIINNKTIEKFFPINILHTFIKQPITISGIDTKLDIFVNVKGGGVVGQASAIRHAIAKAILKYNLEFKSILKSNNLLTRDSRIKERKKPGQPGARKRFQFSKR